VNTTLCNLTDYLASLLKNTNMKCLTPDKALSGECGFMAANLYAKVKYYLQYFCFFV
jgi:coatomer subunit beta